MTNRREFLGAAGLAGMAVLLGAEVPRYVTRYITTIPIGVGFQLKTFAATTTRLLASGIAYDDFHMFYVARCGEDSPWRHVLGHRVIDGKEFCRLGHREDEMEIIPAEELIAYEDERVLPSFCYD